MKAVQLQPVLLSAPEPDTTACKGHALKSTEFKLTVSAAGKPSEISMLRSSGDACVDRSVLRAIAAYRFRPALKGGEPVPVQIWIDSQVDAY